MKFLLDTHFVIWIPINDRRIGRAARALITDPENEFTFSAASLWEIAIKEPRIDRISHSIRGRSDSK